LKERLGMLQAQAETAGMVDTVEECKEQIGEYFENRKMVNVKNVFVRTG
jgi:hypothetical protein